METVAERFIRYVKVNTQSDEASTSCPSTPGQLVLGRMLAEEMEAMGLEDINIDANGYVMGTLPANTKKEMPVIGFIAHMDTSPDNSGDQVKPGRINYEGGDILLNASEQIVLSAADFPELLRYQGQELITTDGTTLLGADDKAGIAEIMTAMDYLQHHPEIVHGGIRIGFTPDEEIGRGADHFDVKKFGASFAYTLDGGSLGELEYENFNAAKAIVNIQGRNVHPGTAKDQMINALLVGMELNKLLPSGETPAQTEHYEGFYHLNDFSGSVEKACLHYIIRDHDQELFHRRKHIMQEAVETLNRKYGSGTLKLTLTDQYYNMKVMIQPVFHIVELAERAMTACGVKTHIIPIRGGTDGSRLSFMGLPCPNIFAGGHNFHSRFEFVPVSSMEKAVQVIVKIAELHALES